MNLVSVLCPLIAAKEHHGGEERPAEEPDTPLPGGTPLLLPDPGEALLRPGLRQWRRGRRPHSTTTTTTTTTLRPLGVIRLQ